MALKKAILAKFHNLEWFGREGLSPKESITKYGIAAKCLNPLVMEFDCFAPDPDDDTYCIRFKVCTDELIQAVRSQKDLAEFLLDNGFMFMSMPTWKLLTCCIILANDMTLWLSCQ